jgi:hypothetical protein
MSGVYDTNVSEEGCITPDSTLGIHIDKYINHQIMAKMMKLYTELKTIYVLRLWKCLLNSPEKSLFDVFFGVIP